MTYNQKIPPFKWFILENFPYIEEDFDALTNWQLFCKLGKEMNKIIQKCNLTGEQVENLTNAFNALQTYVNNYFENLDIQDEIDNKLDEMAESGELTDIIAQYLQLAGVLAYDNKADMKSAENIANGSICKTLGDTSYQDGKGYFYKVRQVRNTDVIDDELIIQLYDENLVAERIPEPEIGHLENLTTNDKSTIINAINNAPSSQTLELGKSITYDIPTTDDVGHMQASCTNGDYLYVCVVGNNTYPNGYIYVFNISDNTYVTKYNVTGMYHGNDITYKDNKLYIACVDDEKLVEYDITAGTSTTLDLFSTDYPDFWTTGISQYNGKLVAWLSPSSNDTTDLNSDKFVMINDDDSFTELEFDDPYNIAKVLHGTIVRQQFDIDTENNLVYILNQQPNVLIEGTIINNKITLQKMYNIPLQDYTTNPIGETESVAVINNQYYSKGSLFITAREFKTEENTTIQYGNDTIQNYVVNPKCSTTMFSNSTQGYYNGAINNFNQLSVKKNGITNLIEQGSSTYPIKDLVRAMNQVRLLSGNTEIRIRDSETYYVPFLFGYDNVKIAIDNNCNPTIYFGNITNSSLTIETSSTNSTVTIKPIATNKRITIKQSTIRLYGAPVSSDTIILENVQFSLSQTNMTTRKTRVNNTENVSSGYAFQVFDGSFFRDQINYTVASGDKYIQYGNGGSIVATDKSSSYLNKVGTGAIINISM